MSRRIVAFVALAVVLATLFVRLGFWQLDRREERRAANDRIRSRLAMPVASFADLVRGRSATFDTTGPSGDLDAPWDRHAVVAGTPDYANEFVVSGRSRGGSPGVHVFTPVRVPGLDRAVLVNRGWVYAADAATADLSRWREDRGAFSGYTQRMPRGHAASPTGGVRGRSIRPLRHDGVERLLPYSFDELYLVSRDSAGNTAPARLPEPDSSDGPHLSYAIQWFCFAAIALVGAAVVAARASKVR